MSGRSLQSFGSAGSGTEPSPSALTVKPVGVAVLLPTDYAHVCRMPVTLTDSGAFTAYFGVKRTVGADVAGRFSLPTTAALMVYSLVLRS